MQRRCVAPVVLSVIDIMVEVSWEVICGSQKDVQGGESSFSCRSDWDVRGADAVIMRGVVPSGGDWTVWSGVMG